MKTWKREIATGMIVLWYLLFARTVWAALDGVEVRGAIDTLSIAAVPVHALWAAAYGMDWAGKQSPWAKRRDDPLPRPPADPLFDPPEAG